MEENVICDYLRLQSLKQKSAIPKLPSNVADLDTSPGPAPMPLRIDAPMKLSYEVALAFQIQLPRESKVETINTGRRPKVELKGILKLYRLFSIAPHMQRSTLHIPDEITKPQNEDCDSRKLYHTRQVSLEFFGQLWKHRCDCQWAKALCEGDEGGRRGGG